MNGRTRQRIARFARGLALGLAAALTLLAPRARAQDVAADSVDYGTGTGLALVLTDSGFALGAYAQTRLGRSTAFTFEAAIGSARDEREVRFLRGQFGGTVIRGKANYVLVLPISLGLEQRVFRSRIEDNFRPYLHVGAGPVLAWQYPYFDDADGDGRYDDDERIYDAFARLFQGRARLGAGGTLAIGARFGRGRAVQGVRFGYLVEYYPVGLQLLEPALRGPDRRRASPVFTLTFGRLL